MADQTMLAGIIAAIALLMSLPALVVLPFLSALLGSDGAAGGITLLMLVSPSLSIFVLLLLKRWDKTGGSGSR